MPVIKTIEQAVRRAKTLDYARRERLASLIQDANLRAIGTRRKIDDVFVDFAVAEPDRKVKSVMLDLATYHDIDGLAEAVNDMKSESIAVNKAIKQHNQKLSEIHAEIDRYFRQRGWLEEEINDAPYFCKYVTRNGIKKAVYVLRGLDQSLAGCRHYVAVLATYKADTMEQFGYEIVYRFNNFHDLKGRGLW